MNTLASRRPLDSLMQASVARTLNRRAFIRHAGAFGIGVSTLGSVISVVGPSTAVAATSLQARGGQVTVAGIGEPKFDPYFLNTPLRDVQAQIFRAPYNYRGPDPYKINNVLVVSDQETDTTLTMTLRQGVKFHNGREVVAQDIVDNIARAKDASLGHNLSAIFDPTVSSAAVIDRYTVKLTYTTTYPTKRQDLVYLFLIPKEAMATVATKPVGCGPFSFTSYTPGDKLVMSRFPNFYEPGKPYLDQVIVKVLPDPEAQIANLSAGAIDEVTAVPPADVTRLQADRSLQVMKYPPGGVWTAILINTRTKPLSNQQVRQALNYTVDRKKIAQFAYFGQFIPTQTRYLPSVEWYDKTADTYYTYDLAKAKALLTQAGYPNGFSTTLKVSSTIPGSIEMAQVWIQDLAKVGVKATIVERDQTAFFDEYFKFNFDLIAYELGDGTIDPATYLANNSPLRLQNNTCGIETQPFFADYKRLVQQGAGSIDPKVRKPIYDQVQELSAEQGWVINLAFVQDALALTQRVKGYRPDITEVTNLTDVWVNG